MKKTHFSCRLLASLLALVCLAGLLPTAALAAGTGAPATITLADYTVNGMGFNSANLGSCRFHRIDFNVSGKIKTAFMAVSLFTTVPVRLYALAVSLQGTLTTGIAGMGTSIGDVGMGIIERFQDVDGLDAVVQAGLLGISVLTSPIMVLFCIILMVYAVVKVFFANLKRSGILLIQIAVGSVSGRRIRRCCWRRKTSRTSPSLGSRS